MCTRPRRAGKGGERGRIRAGRLSICSGSNSRCQPRAFALAHEHAGHAHMRLVLHDWSVQPCSMLDCCAPICPSGKALGAPQHPPPPCPPPPLPPTPTPPPPPPTHLVELLEEEAAVALGCAARLKGREVRLVGLLLVGGWRLMAARGQQGMGVCVRVGGRACGWVGMCVREGVEVVGVCVCCKMGVSVSVVAGGVGEGLLRHAGRPAGPWASHAGGSSRSSEASSPLTPPPSGPLLRHFPSSSCSSPAPAP